MKKITTIRLDGKSECNGCEKCKEETAKVEESEKIGETIGEQLEKEIDKIVHDMAVQAALNETKKELPNTVGGMVRLITQRALDDTKQEITFYLGGKNGSTSTPPLFSICLINAGEFIKVNGTSSIEATVENLQTAFFEVMRADFEAFETRKEATDDDE